MPSIPVQLSPSASAPTADEHLWDVIKERTDAISFERYKVFIDEVMSGGKASLTHQGVPGSKFGASSGTLQSSTTAPQDYSIYGTAAYEVLVEATRVFLLHEAGVFTPEAYLAKDRSAEDLERELDWTVPGGSTGQKASANQGAGAPAAAAATTPGPSNPCADSEPVLCGKVEVSPGQTDRFDLCLSARPGNARDLEKARKSFVASLAASNNRLPYMQTILNALTCLPSKSGTACPGECYGIVEGRVQNPLLLELIWSYWLEEAAVPRTMNALGLRFQNRLSGPNDPLGNFELGPLRAANNLIWGWVQRSYARLDSRRRGFEYEHAYGLRSSMVGHPMGPAADSRTRFVDSFHELIRLCHEFYLRDDDTTVVSDAFPLVNPLRDLHMVLAQGAHNQFGDLPCQARIETLAEMWILSRPEIREFLRSRDMVPHPEPWMGQVDTMRGLQRWGTVPAMQYNLLATVGERILLSVRYGNWTVNIHRQNAKNWARAWRQEIQTYQHALRVVTGLDVTAQPVAPAGRRLTTDGMRAAPRLALRR